MLGSTLIAVTILAFGSIGWVAHQMHAGGRKAVAAFKCAGNKIAGKPCSEQKPLPRFHWPVD